MTQAEKNAILKGLAIIASLETEGQVPAVENYIASYRRLYPEGVGEGMLRARLRKKLSVLKIKRGGEGRGKVEVRRESWWSRLWTGLIKK